MQRCIETEECIKDEEILALSLQDPNAFVHLVRKYEKPFLKKAMKIVYRKEDAEDVVQETFTKIYLNASRFKEVEGASFKSWGYTILIRTACTRYGKKKREILRTTALSVEEFEALPDFQFENSFGSEVKDLVLSLLVKMPEHLAYVLDEHFLKHKPQEQIAAEEGVAVGTIKTRVHRAKAQFRKVAEQYAPFLCI